MKTQDAKLCLTAKRLANMLALGAVMFSARARAVGSWSALANTAHDSVYLMLQLSDGTIMASNNPSCVFDCTGNAWYRLTPDGFGNLRQWPVDHACLDERHPLCLLERSSHGRPGFRSGR